MNDAVRVIAVGLALATGASALGCAAAYRGRIEEFKNPDLSAGRYDVVAVLPVDPGGFDPSIAARVRDHLVKGGWRVVPAAKLVGEGEVTTQEVCRPELRPEYKGIVFVTWDRVILRDCETSAVAYRALGGYAGVDQLTKKLLVYLKTAPASQ